MKISTYTSPFERTPESVKQFPTGKTLKWYLEEMGLSPDHYIIIRNGGVVPHCELDSFIPVAGDDIIAKPFVQGSSGGKTALNILVMAAVVVASVFTAGAGMALWETALIVGGIAAAGAAISTFVIGRPQSSTVNTPTYGWNGPATTAQQGLPVPIPSGTYPNYGNVIASYVESISDQQFLHMLVCMGIGPARKLSTVRINDQPIENYVNATWEGRLGRNVQSVCTDFDALHNVTTIDQRVLAGPGSSPIVINGTQNDTEAVDFTFLFPRGLWAGPNGDGSYDSWAVMMQIEFQKVGDPGWTTYVVPGVLNPVDSVPYWLAVVKDFRYAHGQEVVIDQSLNPNNHYEGQTFSQNVSVVPVDTNSVVQATRTITVTGTWKKNPANSSVGPTYATGSTFSTPSVWSTVACSFESNQAQTPKRYTFRLALPTPGQYNFRITKLGSNQHAGQAARLYSDDGLLFETYSRRGEETWVYSMDEISYQEYTYPNHILLALKVQATNQLSGGGIKVSALVEMDNQDTQGYVHAVRWDQPTSYYRLSETASPSGPAFIQANFTYKPASPAFTEISTTLSPTTGENCIIAVVTSDGLFSNGLSLNSGSVTDDKGNTYELVYLSSVGWPQINIWVAYNATGGVTEVKATGGGNIGNWGCITAAEFTGILSASALDGTASVINNAHSESISSRTFGPVTTTAANDMLVAFSFILSAGITGFTAPPGFSTDYTANANPASGALIGLFHGIASAAAAYSETVGFTGLSGGVGQDVGFLLALKSSALSSATAIDLMGASDGTYRTGLLYGNPSLIQNAAADTSVWGGGGGAFFTATVIDANAFAFEMLIQPDATGDFWLVETDTFNLRYAGGKLIATISGVDIIGSTSLVAGETYHVAFILDNGEGTIMLNGVVDAQHAVSGSISGSVAYARAFSGYLDEVTFYGTFVPQLCRIRKHYLDSVSDHNALEGYPENLPAIKNLHLITDTVNGGAMSPALIDVPFFQRWAERSLTHVPDGAGGVITRYAWDGIIDEVSTLWDAINRVAHVGGATMMRTGFTFTGILDAPSLPKRLINVSQVVKGSFKETWSNVDDRANTIDVSYYDELNFYKKSTVTVQLASVINGGAKPIKAAPVDLRGCTKIARAWHYGNFVLKSTRLLDRTVSFDQTIESLAAWPGEAIYIQHDLPKWGNGGKLLPGCTTTQLLLDQDLDDWDTDQTYTMLIQLKLVPLATGAVIQRIVNNIVYFTVTVFSDTEHAARFVCGTNDYSILDCGNNWVKLDSVAGLSVGDVAAIYAQNYISSRDVDAYDPATRKVTLSSALPVAPSEFDSWTFGSVGKGAPVPFHIGKITRKKDLTATLECIIYADAAYTDDEPQIDPTPVVNDLDATVVSLTGHEVLSPTGIEPLYSVSWHWGPSTAGALVYVSRNGGPEVLFADAGQSTSINIPGFTNDQILVRVVGYDAQDKSAPYRSSPTVSTTLVGYNANPDNVSGFGIAAWDIINTSMELAWNASAQLDVVKYVISYFPYITFNPSQADCDANILATAVGLSTTTQLLSGGLYRGIGTYAIRAVNAGGFFSLTPALIRAYSLDNVQVGVQNKTRTPSTGLMVTNPPEPWIAVAEPTLISGPNGPYMPADITFIPFTMNTGKELILVLTGTTYTISGLVQGEAYYFYYEDPSFLGGNVTIHATQDPTVIVDPAAQGGRFVLNNGKPLTMPVYVSGASAALFVSRPTTYDTSSGVLARSPELAYDKNLLTYAETTVDPAGAGSQTLTYRAFDPLPSGFSPTTMELLIDTDLEIMGSGGDPYLEYSPDNGVTWIPLTAGGATSATQFVPASLWASNFTFNTSQYEYVAPQLRTHGVSSPTLTDYVIARGFNLNIPSGASITGIRADLEWVGQNPGTGVIEGVSLYLGGSQIGVTRNPGTTNSNVITDAIYGSNGDMWGLSSLLPAQANDFTFGFGVQILAQQSGSTNRSFIDKMTLTVYYTVLPPHQYGAALSPSQDPGQVQVRVTPNYTDVTDYTMVKIFDTRIEARL